MQGASAAEVFGATKWFGEATALDRVDLRVEPGSVHGLVGPNGAGKTTLLALLFGLVGPDEGRVRLFGRSRAEAGAAWLDGIAGFVEAPRFYPYLTGARNLAVLAALDGRREPAPVAEVLEQVGLGAAGDRKVKGYSLGMRQRLGLAAALLRRPRLLILDEPANGLDPGGIRDLRRFLREQADAGVAVVLSSHDMAQIAEVCDRVTVLHRSRVVFDGSVDRMRLEAPDATWILHTSDDAAALAVAEAGTGPGEVKVTERAGGGLTVQGDQHVVDRYVLALARAEVAVRGLALDVTPLESLFFELTRGSSS
jgi:ABC-2 type transport system ATP-binding protein